MLVELARIVVGVLQLDVGEFGLHPRHDLIALADDARRDGARKPAEIEVRPIDPLHRTLPGNDGTLMSRREKIRARPPVELTIEGLSHEGRGLASHADRSMGEADRALAELEKSLSATRALLERRAPELDRILVNLASVLQQSDALLARFRAEDQPEVEASLKALRRSLDSVEELLQLLKQKPNRIVWGTPGEAEREKARKALEAAKTAPAPK